MLSTPGELHIGKNREAIRVGLPGEFERVGVGAGEGIEDEDALAEVAIREMPAVSYCFHRLV
jgi:hypothetical protein